MNLKEFNENKINPGKPHSWVVFDTTSGKSKEIVISKKDFDKYEVIDDGDGDYPTVRKLK
ncbi:hypothetical protein COB55_05585 [Candidatus Wolfebacteria bacterium]|nr:MAG: hypothetical protein COB55_05585 [Candidatus Wolfebacteria bacterium]